jgi:hypothetical protein
MTPAKPQRRVLLIGKTQLALYEAVAGLREWGPKTD